MDRTVGYMGDQIVLTGTFDSVGYSASMNLTGLAEGETISVTASFELTSWKTFGTGTHATTTEEIEFVVIGVNDIPTLIAEGLTLSVAEDGPVQTLDLTPYADDVDSDDSADTLTYEIVSAPEGFDVWIDGGTLVYSPSNLDQRMTSDETIDGQVDLRVVDRHGAASDTILVDLQAIGADDPTAVFVTSSGVDLAGLGIDPSSHPDQGDLVAGFGLPVSPDIVAFTDDADTKVINAGRVSGFQEGTHLVDENGVEYSEDANFDTGDGDDRLIFNVTDPVEALFELNDISMGHGEDILAVNVDGPTGVINGMNASTGIHSDQVWVSLDVDNGWINANLDTGSGHDIVEVHFTDVDTATVGGLGFIDLGVSLGTGDDSLNVVVDAGDRQLNAEMDVTIYAGAGDDHVNLSNIDTTLVLSPDLPTGGQWDDLHSAGMHGSVYLEDGDDILELAINDAYVSGASAILDGGAGFDELILHHLSASDISVTQNLNGSFVVVDGFQTLNISDFESITLGDGTNLFDMV